MVDSSQLIPQVLVVLLECCELSSEVRDHPSECFEGGIYLVHGGVFS